MKAMKLLKGDIERINMVQNNEFSIEDIYSLTDEIFNLVEPVCGLIGYDSIKDDIDDLGRLADEIISKLLYIVEKRNETVTT